MDVCDFVLLQFTRLFDEKISCVVNTSPKNVLDMLFCFGAGSVRCVHFFFSDTSKLNESVSWRLSSPINRFLHYLVNSISFSCLIKTAFTQITEILLLVCVIAHEPGGARSCEIIRTDTLVLVLTLVQVPVLSLVSLNLLHVYIHILQLTRLTCLRIRRGIVDHNFSFFLNSTFPYLIRTSTHYSITTLSSWSAESLQGPDSS